MTGWKKLCLLYGRILRWANGTRLSVIELYRETEIEWRDCLYQFTATIASHLLCRVVQSAADGWILDMDGVVQYENNFFFRHPMLWDTVIIFLTLLLPAVIAALLLDREYMEQYKRTVDFDKYTDHICAKSALLLALPGETLRLGLSIISYFTAFDFGLFVIRLDGSFNIAGERMTKLLRKILSTEGVLYWLLFASAHLITSAASLGLHLLIYRYIWNQTERKYRILAKKQQNP